MCRCSNWLAGSGRASDCRKHQRHSCSPKHMTVTPGGACVFIVGAACSRCRAGADQIDCRRPVCCPSCEDPGQVAAADSQPREPRNETLTGKTIELSICSRPHESHNLWQYWRQRKAPELFRPGRLSSHPSRSGLDVQPSDAIQTCRSAQ